MRRDPLLRLVLVCLLGAMASGLAACAGSEDKAEQTTQTETALGRRVTDAVVRVDAAGRVRDVVPVPYGLEMRLVDGYLWVHHRSDGDLSRVDPVSRRARAFHVGEVAGIAATDDGLWVTLDGNRIALLDGRTGALKRSLRVGRRKLFELGDAGFLAVVGDSVWLTVPELGTQHAQALWEVDARTGRTKHKYAIGVDPTPPRVAGHALWFVTYDHGLVRFDTDSRRLDAIEAGSRPWGYTTGAGSFWVGNELPGEVRRLDPASGRILAVINTEPKVRGLGFGGGFVWVATETGLQRIDPRTNRVTRTTTITTRVNDEGPIGIVYVAPDVWVSVE